MKKIVEWKDTGWNGVRFPVPAEWEPVQIEDRYLLFGQDGAPVLEIKWHPAHSGFSPEKELVRLSGVYQKKSGTPLTSSPLPPAWKSALTTATTSVGFRFQENGHEGTGSLFCTTPSGNAVFIRFFRKDNRTPEAVSSRILTGFTDKNPDGFRLWALFDIFAEIPESFELKKYRFLPGEFELHLAGKKGRHLHLYRWGPASVLLRNRNLQEFAAKRLQISPDHFIQKHKNLVEWTRWVSRFRFLGKTRNHGRIWHLPEKNRILGLVLSGDRSSTPDFPDELRRGFRCL